MFMLFPLDVHFILNSVEYLCCRGTFVLNSMTAFIVEVYRILSCLYVVVVY